MENGKNKGENQENVFASLFKLAKTEKENKDKLTWKLGKSGEIKLKKETLQEIQNDIFENCKGEIKGLTLEIVQNTLDKNYVSKNSTFFKEIKTILENDEKYVQEMKK